MRGACYTPGMARFGRKRTSDSTAVANPAPEAESPAATPVKPSRSRKPSPPEPPVLDAPPVLDSADEAPALGPADEADLRDQYKGGRTWPPSHDEEW